MKAGKKLPVRFFFQKIPALSGSRAAENDLFRSEYGSPLKSYIQIGADLFFRNGISDHRHGSRKKIAHAVTCQMRISHSLA